LILELKFEFDSRSSEAQNTFMVLLIGKIERNKDLRSYTFMVYVIFIIS